jgi:hypothetical protein
MASAPLADASPPRTSVGVCFPPDSSYAMTQEHKTGQEVIVLCYGFIAYCQLHIVLALIFGKELMIRMAVVILINLSSKHSLSFLF